MLALPLRGSTPELYHGKYVAGMFANGERGVWYDPSDLSTMYQDAAGTIPVTAVGQPVGKILDKSGRGNHATQATTASRPTLSARVNLLTKTEQFNDAAWSKTNATIAANAVVAPDGTTTADTFIPGAGTVFGLASGAYFNSLNYFSQMVSVAAATYKYRLRVKDAGYDMAQLRVSEGPTLTGTNQAVTRVLLSNGAVNSQGGTGNLTNVTSACTRTDDGWCDITLTFTSGAAQTLYFGIWAWNTTAITSDGVKGLHIWGADLRVANESASLPAYQRVNTSTDYDTAGFPYYLLFDGVDDYLSTGSIDFTATDKMTVLSGARAFDGHIYNTIVAQNYPNSPSWYHLLKRNLPREMSVENGRRGSGSNAFTNTPNDFSGLYDGNIVTAYAFDLAKTPELVTQRVNGAVKINGYGIDSGVGPLANAPLYIGSINATQHRLTGRLYGLIVRGAATDDLHLTHAEKFLAYKSGVSL